MSITINRKKNITLHPGKKINILPANIDFKQFSLCISTFTHIINEKSYLIICAAILKNLTALQNFFLQQIPYIFPHLSLLLPDDSGILAKRQTVNSIGPCFTWLIKSVATVVAANYGRIMRKGDYTADAAIEMPETVSAQRTAQARSAEPLVTVYIPNSQEERIAAGMNDIKEAVDYSKTPRGEIPNSPNRLRFDSLDKVLAFDAFHLANHLLTQPLMVIEGDKISAYGSYRDGFELFNKAASENQHIHVVQEASHYDLYDQAKPTEEALEKLIPFFKKNL